MPTRIAMGAATWWDPVLASFLTVAAIAGLIMLGGRVYTRAILHTGPTLTLGEAWRGTPRPSNADVPVTTGSTESTKEAAAVTQPTTREARAHVILIVIAIAVGGVVFALAGDFVIGVAVGAAVFALARQGMAARSRHADDRTSPRERDREQVHR